MPPSLQIAEPLHVSARFQLTLQSAILALEADAAEDERTLPSSTMPITAAASNS